MCATVRRGRLLTDRHRGRWGNGGRGGEKREEKGKKEKEKKKEEAKKRKKAKGEKRKGIKLEKERRGFALSRRPHTAYPSTYLSLSQSVSAQSFGRSGRRAMARYHGRTCGGAAAGSAGGYV